MQCTVFYKMTILLVCIHWVMLFSHYFKVHSLYEKVYYKPVSVMLHQETALYILSPHSWIHQDVPWSD